MSALPRPLVVVLWPYRRLGTRGALAAVVVTAVVCGGAVTATADAVAGSVTGTETVDNPSRPPDWVCEQRSGGEIATPSGCGLAAEIEVSRAAEAATAVRQLLPGTVIAVLAVWLAFAALFASGGALDEVAPAVAWALPPLTLPALARALVAVRVAPHVTWAGTLSAVVGEARELAVGVVPPTGDGFAGWGGSVPYWLFEPSFGGVSALVLGASLVALCWSGVVLYGVARDRLASVSGVVAPVIGPAVLATGLLVGAPPTGSLSAGVILALAGTPLAFAPRFVLQLSARAELIGYRGTRDVEPTDWYVGVNRALGVGIVLTGLVLARVPGYLL